jgi:hypothetical protein
MPNSSESERIDSATSQACTKSGAFALLVSVFLLLLTTNWQERKTDEALAQYVARRANLGLYIDTLDHDKVWKKYKEVHSDADRVSISSLTHASVQITDSTEIANNKQPDPHAPQMDSKVTPGAPRAPVRPMPPTLVSVTVTSLIDPYEMQALVDSIRSLNGSAVLSKGRAASNFFDISIARWAQRRNILIYGNAITGVCSVSRIEIPSKLPPLPQYVSQIDETALLDCLTLTDLRELAEFEYPTMSNPTQLGAHISRAVEVSPGSFPRELYPASVLAESVLLFALVYFAVFTREAITSENFPAAATLFGAFSRSTWQLWVFSSALWMPVFACFVISFTSGKLILALGVVPIFLCTLSVQSALEQKSFFKRFKPVSIFGKTGRKFLRGLQGFRQGA